MSVGTKKSSKSYSFQAEVSRLLHLMVHSVYTEKEIFLRELISNASDACDKLRYMAVTRSELLGEDAELGISIGIDKTNRVLSIHDNGVGMTRKEMIDNLGTIAKSGTKAFLDKIEKEKDGSGLIGQFGVGFYSAFMVADKIEVISRKAGGKACTKWISQGGDGFAVDPASAEEAEVCQRGTHIKLFLNEDSSKYLEAHEIERIVHAYSDHVSFPIFLIPDEGSTDAPKQLNSGSALWTRSKSEITPEEYSGFFKQIAVPFDEPSLTLHYRAEGRHEYSVLLFVPTLKPFDLYDPERKGRVRLYVRRVFITDDAELLPAYLRFVRGVIDSQDVPLNISREMLQNNPIVTSIRKAVTKKVLSEIKKQSRKDKEAHEKFWDTFGAVMKEGLYEDPSHRDELYEIVRFKTTTSEGWRSLEEYVADMHEKQDAIYYLAGGTMEQLKASPQLEGFKARGIEVLLLADSVDNFWVTNAVGYDSKQFVSISQGDTDISHIPLPEGSEDADKPEEEANSDGLIAKIKEILGEAISDVKVSKRLVTSPTCLVAPSGGPDRGLEKIIGRTDTNPTVAPVLEVNVNHAMLKALNSKIVDEKANDVEDLTWVLFDQALILEGDMPSDPAKFSERLNRLVLGKV